MTCRSAAGIPRSKPTRREQRPLHLRPPVRRQELVNIVLALRLSGERSWEPREDATEDEIVAFLFGLMRGACANVRTSAVVARSAAFDEDAAPSIDDGSSAEQIVMARARLAQVQTALEGDDEALGFCRALQDCPSGREEIAGVLGWTVRRVTVVRWRIKRFLAAKGLTYDEVDEAGPPSPSPQRRPHEDPQAPGERRRAPRQPEGGPRLAGRRR